MLARGPAICVVMLCSSPWPGHMCGYALLARGLAIRVVMLCSGPWPGHICGHALCWPVARPYVWSCSVLPLLLWCADPALPCPALCVQAKVKMVTADDESSIDIIIEADEGEIERFAKVG